MYELNLMWISFGYIGGAILFSAIKKPYGEDYP